MGMEASCDDENRQLDVNAVTFVRSKPEALAEGAVCRDVGGSESKEGQIEGRLKTNCGPETLQEGGTGSVTKDLEADIQQGNCSKVEDVKGNETAKIPDHKAYKYFFFTCKSKERKFEEYRYTKVSSKQEYGDDQTILCDKAIARFKEGQELKHPKSCTRPTASSELYKEVEKVEMV